VGVISMIGVLFMVGVMLVPSPGTLRRRIKIFEQMMHAMGLGSGQKEDEKGNAADGAGRAEVGFDVFHGFGLFISCAGLGREKDLSPISILCQQESFTAQLGFS
jgi:hypothetical protein